MNRTLALLLAAAYCATGCQSAHQHDHDLPHTHGPGGEIHYHDQPAQNAADIAKTAEEMASAAQAFLASLSDEQKEKAVFELSDAERKNWHFIPRERKGLPLKQMDEKQQKLAHDFLNTGLSKRGYLTATQVIDLENVLREIEKRDMRDASLYFVSIFGNPDAKEFWGWRFEGHHLSINFTVAGGKIISGSPVFYGSNPGRILDGPRKDERVLGETEDLGRALVKSLDDGQKKSAIIMPEAPADILMLSDRKEGLGDPAGLAWGAMNQIQKEMLITLIDHYAHRLREELAGRDLEQIREAGLDKVHFAWAGGLEVGQPHYYRVHGPTFVIEYDNTQNNANHVHSIWRDLVNEFGDDLLKKHYEEHKDDPDHGHDK